VYRSSLSLRFGSLQGAANRSTSLTLISVRHFYLDIFHSILRLLKKFVQGAAAGAARPTTRILALSTLLPQPQFLRLRLVVFARVRVRGVNEDTS
jgi:hypothetical protein